MRLLAVPLLLLLALPLHALQPEPIPFSSGARAAQPSVAVDPREGFVVTWQERDDAGAVLNFAVIDDDGVERRRGEIARGRDWFVNGADFPSLVVLDNGDWISFYLQKTSAGTYSYAIHTVRSRDAGRHWEAPVVIHRDGTDTEHGFVSMVAAGGDLVRMVWLDGRHMHGAGNDHAHGAAGERMSLRSAALGRDGVPFDEIELDDLTCACCQTGAVRVGNGMRVVYRDRSPEERRDIAVIEHDGRRWQAPRPLHHDGWIIAACPVNGPQTAIDAGGRSAVVWPTMADGPMQLKLATIDRDGRIDPPRVLAGGESELGRVSIAALEDGWLVGRVVTQARVARVRLVRLHADGRVQATHDLGDRVGGFPRLAVHAGRALIVWAEAGDAPHRSRIGIARLRVGGIAPAAGP